MTLPAGWTIEAATEEEQKQDILPPGWKVENTPKKATTPKERDEEKLKKEAGIFAAPEKTPEELKKMSVWEKMEYIEDLKREIDFLQMSQFVKSGLSGLTFGLSKNVDALKPIEFEETNLYSIIGTTGEVTGSLLPLTRLMKVFAGPAMKLASKSPVFQEQLSSLATMFGVGATDKALHQVMKGEIPSAEEVLEHGVEWAALDALLQTAGYVGLFAKSLLTRSKATGIPRTQLINDINKELAESGIDMSNAEAVSQKALEILEAPIPEAELAATRQLQMPQKAESAVEKVAQEAITPQEITPKDLKTRKIQEEPVNKLTSEIRIRSEPYQPEGINFTKEAESLEKTAIQEQIDSVGSRAATEEELGNSIKEDIENQLESRKEEYRPLYTEAEEAAANMTHTPETLVEEASKKLRKISRLVTKPEGYGKVINNLEGVLNDSGYVVVRDKSGNINIMKYDEVSVSDTIELARRLNEIIDYEAVEPTVKDALRSVARAAKQDIRTGLASNADALAAFELAEEAHAQTAGRFNRKSIHRIRGQEAGEKISKMAESPSTFGELKEVLSPQQMLQLEREMLERLNNQSYEKAKKTLKDLEGHMSAENKKLAEEIVEAKNPHNPSVRKKLTQDAILNDMSNAFTNGTRPEKTLDIWKTPKGQKLIKETFQGSPNWPQVKNYLENQSFNDMVSSVLKDGKIDMKKFKSFMRDQAAVNNIRSVGGEEAVNFFNNLDSQVKQLEQNIKLLDKFPTSDQIKKGLKFAKESPGQKRLEQGVAKSKRVERETTKLGEEALRKKQAIRKETTGESGSKILKRMVEKDFPIQSKIKKWREIFTETMGLNEKGLLSVFGLMKLGLPNTVTSLVGYRLFNNLLTSPRLRRAFTEAAKHQPNSLKFILSLEHLGNEMEEDLE